ncbi:biotin-dependent carboxyltransferase family protein [uncultured Thiodictyon sp.]|uniref:5-oxoprolinase subunit C family protein n=1 Tax=uncultured Thiodictyon sp. TaxID=1846217 RepID=UPI0025CCDEBD|nr:biotin-dependent carboxyltransferase family protein [uncultured Thiodictyon sp.]
MLKVLRGGQLSTVQDAGRMGWQALGVTPGGALDAVALRVGNWLVGNADHLAAIEMTWAGLQVSFTEDTLIALTGARAEVSCEERSVPFWRPLWISRGSVLRMGQVIAGARVYLCVQGGIMAPVVMGGLGTDLRNRFGGYEGRALKAGDTLALRPQQDRYPRLRVLLRQHGSGFASPPWQVSMWRDSGLPGDRPIRLLAGPHQSGLGDQGVATLHSAEFRVLPQSDRQALRLQGVALTAANDRQPSAGVCFGVLQLPPDGHPILLLADHQTTGGYPVIGVAASVERTRLAQLKPGDSVHFVGCGQDEAHRLLQERERRLMTIRHELAWRAQYG